MASSPRSLIHHDPTLWRASVQEPQQAAESSQETEPEPGGPKVVSGYSVAISVTPDLRGSSWCAFLSLSKDLESLHHYFSSCFVRCPTSDLRHRSTVQLVIINMQHLVKTPGYASNISDCVIPISETLHLWMSPGEVMHRCRSKTPPTTPGPVCPLIGGGWCRLLVSADWPCRLVKQPMIRECTSPFWTVDVCSGVCFILSCND